MATSPTRPRNRGRLWIGIAAAVAVVCAQAWLVVAGAAGASASNPVPTLSPLPSISLLPSPSPSPSPSGSGGSGGGGGSGGSSGSTAPPPKASSGSSATSSKSGTGTAAKAAGSVLAPRARHRKIGEGTSGCVTTPTTALLARLAAQEPVPPFVLAEPRGMEGPQSTVRVQRLLRIARRRDHVSMRKAFLHVAGPFPVAGPASWSNDWHAFRP